MKKVIRSAIFSALILVSLNSYALPDRPNRYITTPQGRLYVAANVLQSQLYEWERAGCDSNDLSVAFSEPHRYLNDLKVCHNKEQKIDRQKDIINTALSELQISLPEFSWKEMKSYTWKDKIDMILGKHGYQAIVTEDDVEWASDRDPGGAD